MKQCKYDKFCGGCKYLDVEYSTQLQDKSRYLTRLMRDYGIDVGSIAVNGMHYPYGYRNKVHLAFKMLKGKPIIGFFEEGSSKVVDIDSCLLNGEWLGKLIVILRGFVKRFKISIYDPMTKVGTLRYAVARCIDNDIQLTLVTTTKNFAGREYLYSKLCQNFGVVSLYLNINKRTDKLVFDDKGFQLIKGEKYLCSTLLGVKYCLTPDSFLQVNRDICKNMYKTAIDWLQPLPSDNILDLYSGIGITSVLLARQCARVDSIEYNASATSMARNIMRLNDVQNVFIHTGDCASEIAKLNVSEYSKVFLDPARAGAEENTLDTIIKSNIKRIVYMSCNPETLARDLSRLSQYYTISRIEAWDMFPFTEHIETLVLCERK